MPDQRWVIREMSPADIDFAMEAVRSVGWISECRESFQNHLGHDPRGCFVAEAGSQKLGICIATRYQDHGFIGNLIVIPAQRIFGLGRHLFDRAFDYLTAQGIATIHLDGDLNAVPFYEQRGFRKVCRSLRFKGTVPARSHSLIRPLRKDDLDDVCALDRELFGDDRGFYLRSVAGQFPRFCFVSESRKVIDGFIMAKHGQGIIAVGPWAIAAGTRADPAALLEHLAHECGGGPVRIGVLESNHRAARVIRSWEGLQETTHSWFMVHGESKRLGSHPRLWAIGSGAKG